MALFPNYAACTYRKQTWDGAIWGNCQAVSLSCQISWASFHTAPMRRVTIACLDLIGWQTRGCCHAKSLFRLGKCALTIRLLSVGILTLQNRKIAIPKLRPIKSPQVAPHAQEARLYCDVITNPKYHSCLLQHFFTNTTLSRCSIIGIWGDHGDLDVRKPIFYAMLAYFYHIFIIFMPPDWQRWP